MKKLFLMLCILFYCDLATAQIREQRLDSSGLYILFSSGQSLTYNQSILLTLFTTLITKPLVVNYIKGEIASRSDYMMNNIELDFNWPSGTFVYSRQSLH